MALAIDEFQPVAWDAFVEKRKDTVGRSVIDGFLWDAKTRFWECLASGDECDVRLVRGPKDAEPIDGACSTICTSYENLLEMRARGRTSALVVPILAMRREVFTESGAEAWMDARGIAVNALLFDDDVEGVVESARAVASNTVVVEEVPVVTALRNRRNDPGACGCHSSLVASQLLARAAELGPAARPGPRRPGEQGKGHLFATGPASGDALFTEMLALLREVIMTMSVNFSENWKDISWCSADEDVAQAVTALFQFQ